MANVTILGVGKMGGAMARELAAANHSVTLWNRTAAAAQAVADNIDEAHVIVAADVREALSAAEIVICTFTNGSVTQDVLLSDPELLTSLPSSLIIIDMGTSGVDSAKRLDSAISAAGLRFVDAPVSGSMATIASHQLLVMASGSQSAVNEVEPVLMSFSKKVAYLGHAGAGQAMKLAINLIVHSLNAAVAEGLALATAAGIEPSAAYDLFEESVIAAPFVKYKRSAFLDKSAPVAMRMDTVVKDLNLILGLGTSSQTELTAGKAVAELYESACQAGFSERDMASLFRYLK